MSIAENIARVRANIAAAAKEAGRNVSEITLVGASKMNDADACRQAIAAGIDVLGENREQEMTCLLYTSPTATPARAPHCRRSRAAGAENR